MVDTSLPIKALKLSYEAFKEIMSQNSIEEDGDGEFQKIFQTLKQERVLSNSTINNASQQTWDKLSLPGGIKDALLNWAKPFAIEKKRLYSEYSDNQPFQKITKISKMESALDIMNTKEWKQYIQDPTKFWQILPVNWVSHYSFVSTYF